jgi:hypothetical protein
LNPSVESPRFTVVRKYTPADFALSSHGACHFNKALSPKLDVDERPQMVAGTMLPRTIEGAVEISCHTALSRSYVRKLRNDGILGAGGDVLADPNQTRVLTQRLAGGRRRLI